MQKRWIIVCVIAPILAIWIGVKLTSSDPPAQVDLLKPPPKSVHVQTTQKFKAELANMQKIVGRAQKTLDAMPESPLTAMSNGHDWKRASHDNRMQICETVAYRDGSRKRDAKWFYDCLDEFYGAADDTKLDETIATVASFGAAINNNER